MKLDFDEIIDFLWDIANDTKIAANHKISAAKACSDVLYKTKQLDLKQGTSSSEGLNIIIGDDDDEDED